ncbi:hypothetical protein FRC02_004353 [Tulasnella sp. 418]|nr:hypothetical protein FRC02_004353 [Tulasnella sp. 418]
MGSKLSFYCYTKPHHEIQRGSQKLAEVAFSQLWSRLFGKEELKLLILGLDNAGKTTILYKVTMGEAVETAPTVGSNHEVFEYKNLRFALWDIGGQTAIRASWPQYFASARAVILVIDSTDTQRLELNKEELHRICADEVGLDCEFPAHLADHLFALTRGSRIHCFLY